MSTDKTLKARFLNTFLPALFIAAVILFLFKDLLRTFYQQEEWMALGNILVHGPAYIFFNTESLFSAILGQGRILSSLLAYFLVGSFPFDTTPLQVFAISLHLANTLLVFILARSLFKRTIPAILASLFFGANAVAQSAATWPAAAVGTLPATALILISLLIYFKGLEKGRFFIALVIVYISLFFKEIGIFLFLLFPLFTLLFFNSSPQKILRSKYIYLASIPVIIIVIRLLQLKSTVTQAALFLTGSSDYFFPTLVARSTLYPLTSFSLTFVPPEMFLNFARFVTNIYYPFFPPEQFILIAQTAVLDMLAILVSFSLFVLLFFLSRKTDDKNKKILWFFVLFTFASFLPYVVIAKSFAYLESRYYYLAAVSSAFILSWVLNTVWSKSKRVAWLLSLFAFLLVATHALTVERDVAKQAELAGERKSFLSQLTTIKPTLESKSNIFLITGSDDFYLPGNKVPFQNGVGHILAVWYFYHTGGVPVGLIKAGQLFELGSQGYFEYEGMGFGYFSDLDAMKKEIGLHNLDRSAVVGLYYDAKGQTLKDISQEVINKL